MSEIIKFEDDTLVPIGDSIIQAAEQAEKRIDAVIKIKKLCMRVCNSHDFIAQGDRPYLAVSGAEKIARLFGVSWTIGEPELEFTEDGHFQFTYKGLFTLGGASIEAIGTRSSKDGFFKKYGRDDSGESVVLPPSEIDKGDVKKSAYTNLLGNGITRLLGIRSLQWEDLKDAGIEKDKVVGIKYRDGKDGDVSGDVGLKRAEYNTRIESALKTIYGEDRDAMKKKLIELTTWTNKNGETVKGNANYLGIKSDKSVEILAHKLEALIPKDKIPSKCANCGEVEPNHLADCPYSGN